MQVIGCQLNIVWEDKRANFARVRDLLAQATIEPGAMIVLPEMFATGFSMQVDRTAEAAEGETKSFLAQLAREKSSFVVGGVVTRNADGRGRNEALVIGPNGSEVARYCKLHPFSFAGEDRHFAPGDATLSFAWGSFQVAPFVCYDLRFPEIFRHQTRLGAQVLVVIANWPAPRDTHWQSLLRARAVENQAYVIGVNRVGSDPTLAYAGHSLILDPRGETLAAGSDREELVSARLELEPLLEYRRQFPALNDMRAEYFRPF
jgi:omega-amidase